MDDYQHLLSSEAKDLKESKTDKIRRHFQKRRESGGGDCGMTDKAGGSTYKICFKEKEDQEKVLQRKFQHISLPCEELHLTTFTKTDTKGLQKIFKPDIFLLYYLRDSPKANTVLQKQLSSIGFTVKFNFDEEEAVVRGDIEKGPGGVIGGVAEKWEMQVDQVFIGLTESYVCYHVVEPKKVKILLQDLSFVNDDIKVYRASGYVVVVGEDEVVKERIAILEKSLLTRRELPVLEKQFKLVEEEFSREMGAICPEVKIHRGNAMIILEGPDNEVQSGATKLDELIKKVKEKRVKLCTALLTFITSSGAISKYEARFQQSLRNPVSLEVGSDLVLSSLSSHALDEAESAVLRDLNVANVSGPRCLEVQEGPLACVTLDTLVLDGPGAQRYFKEEGKESKELVENSCHVRISEQQGLDSPNVTKSIPTTPQSCAINKTSLEIKLGRLVDQQVKVLVVPMLNRQLNSTKIGKCLLSKAGDAIKSKLDLVAANSTLAPGDVLQVDAPPSLGCSKLFFIECLPWDGVRGRSVQALGNGLKRCLDLCVQQHLCSVAFPIIGPGIVLKFPLSEAIQVLTENIRQVGLSASSGSLSTIHIVIKPGYPDSEACYHDVYRHLSLNMNQGGQAIFRSLTSDLDDITMTLRGGVTLQLVFGNITNETTDAVVNTTDFIHFQRDGVCKDILAIAGPEVKAALKAAKVNRGDVFKTQPGSFPCKAILHVRGKKDVGLIEQLVCSIIERCETSEFKSVAIPAICAGTGGLDPGVVAGAILRGVSTTSSTSLDCLTNIRLVLNKIDVFLAFKEKAMQMFSTPIKRDLSIHGTSSTSQQSVFLIVGLSRKEVDNAMTKLKNLYQAQCSTQTFKKEELADLTQDNMKDLKQLVETQGLNMQEDQSGQGSLTVSGFKDGVNQVMQMINTSLQGSFRRKVRVREEEDLYPRVAWCILGHNGNWERLPKTANHKLENNDTAGGIVDAQGTLWSVDLQRMEATRRVPEQTAKLKRLVNLPDLALPLYWDNMADGEVLKRVTLQPSSAEYQTVKEAFKRTVTKTVMKIERLQNVHLRRPYEVQKKQISDKNKDQGGAAEKLLYHGTTQGNCDSIIKTGFNRRFAGQNATVYGQGTYFAVKARYSAHPTYSRPAADGSQLMFVVRVLTGIYTQGQSDMRVPPPRSDQQPHDRYDSVVNRMNNPSMYVVFHDSQAYPDYLITFK